MFAIAEGSIHALRQAQQSMKTFLQFLLAVMLCLSCVASRSASAQQQAIDLVTIEKGDLPLILSAPHGGSEAIPGVPERRGEGVDRFTVKTDDNTDELTKLLADAVEKKLGQRPYVVSARFHRKYLDVNRRERDAYESPNAKEVYDAYHQALAKARADVIEKWGYGLLCDIHGQAAEPKAVLRGTQNSKTTTHLVNRFGREALIGETSLFGRIAKQDVPVIPAVDSADHEHERYDGGYIVITELLHSLNSSPKGP
jgi:N-formylglutamate amidohydrolase